MQAAKADLADILIAELAEEKTKAANVVPSVKVDATPGTGAVPLAKPAEPTAEKPDDSDPKALAEWEWNNNDPKGFSTKDRYVAIRVAEIKGQLRTSSK